MLEGRVTYCLGDGEGRVLMTMRVLASAGLWDGHLDLFFKRFGLFIFITVFLAARVFLAACSLLQLQRVEATLCCSAWPSHGGSFSSAAQALGVQASVVAVCGISSCSLQALEHPTQQLRHMG